VQYRALLKMLQKKEQSSLQYKKFYGVLATTLFLLTFIVGQATPDSISLKNGVMLRYIAAGKGPTPIIFIHGYSFCADAWEKGLAKIPPDQFNRIRNPTLVVASTHHIVPFTVATSLSEGIPYCQSFVAERAGHAPMWERPDR
jgi:pimeloyl-ACP methyl ester carboxylesterase